MLNQHKDKRHIQTQYMDNPQNIYVEYQLCNAQKRVGFGAVPLTPIKIFTGDPDYCNDIPDIIQAHRIVRDSGLQTF